MRLHFPEPLRLLPYVLASAIVTRLIGDVMYGRFLIHDDSFWPARYSQLIPLGGTTALFLEWGALLGVAAGLCSNQTRLWTARIGIVVMLYSLSQFFQNQKLLLLFVLVAISYGPLVKGSIAQGNLRFLVSTAYASAALHKLLNEFYSGDALVRALESVVAMAPHLSTLDYRPSLANFLIESGLAKFISWATILAQGAIPLLLWKTPRLGISAVAAFHIGLSLVMPDILPFGLTMFAAAISWTREKENPA